MDSPVTREHAALCQESWNPAASSRVPCLLPTTDAEERTMLDTARTITRATLAGVIASVAMSMVAMIAAATYQATGFFTPLYHRFARGRARLDDGAQVAASAGTNPHPPARPGSRGTHRGGHGVRRRCVRR